MPDLQIFCLEFYRSFFIVVDKILDILDFQITWNQLKNALWQDEQGFFHFLFAIFNALSPCLQDLRFFDQKNNSILAIFKLLSLLSIEQKTQLWKKIVFTFNCFHI